MAKPPKKPKLEEIETEPDAWPRFERFIKKVAKAGPQHRKAPKSVPPKRPKAKKEAQSVSDMLTPSEIASLRREAKETSAFAQKAYAHRRPKSEKETPAK